MGQTIVIADDEDDVRMLLRARLAGRGYTVVEAADGRQALRLIQQARPALAILDNKMPHLDGLEVCRAVKADPALRPIKVLMITASQSGIPAEALRAAQADGFLAKPFQGADLLACVGRLLQGPEDR